MQITRTENAAKVITVFPDVIFPYDSKDCLTGIKTLTGLTPDLTKGLGRINSLIGNIKNRLEPQVSELLANECEKYEKELRMESINLDWLIENISVVLVTDKDVQEKNTATVRDLFKSRLLGDCEDAYTEEPIVYHDDLLGVYIPKVGCIMLWIDKICQNENPELLYQKVLLHEMIHALMDICPRIVTPAEIKRLCHNYDMSKEETYDNTLVLNAYEDTLAFPEVQTIIGNQPPAYRDALNEYAKGPYKYTEDIYRLLEEKVSQGTLGDQCTFAGYIIDNGDDDKLSENPLLKSELEEIANWIDDIIDYESRTDIEKILPGATHCEWQLRNPIYMENNVIDVIRLTERTYSDYRCLLVRLGKRYLFKVIETIEKGIGEDNEVYYILNKSDIEVYDLISAKRLQNCKITKDEEIADWLAYFAQNFKLGEDTKLNNPVEFLIEEG